MYYLCIRINKIIIIIIAGPAIALQYTGPSFAGAGHIVAMSIKTNSHYLSKDDRPADVVSFTSQFQNCRHSNHLKS
jgi:hypothetical protein